MKKIEKITSASFLILAAILFVVLFAWNPCSYALIVPSFFSVIGISIIAIAKYNAKNEKKQLALNA